MVVGDANDGQKKMKGRLLDAIPLTSLSGVGASQADKLAKLGLETIQDLLLHLPLRYEDCTRLYTINDLQPGIFATIEGEVLRSDISFGRRRMLTCQISDGTGMATLRFFNFNAAMKTAWQQVAVLPLMVKSNAARLVLKSFIRNTAFRVKTAKSFCRNH